MRTGRPARLIPRLMRGEQQKFGGSIQPTPLPFGQARRWQVAWQIDLGR